MSVPYALTAAAERDLREIIRYTRKQWGNAQVRAYVEKLERCALAIACGEGTFREMSNLHPTLRMTRCEHHYIFCLRRQNQPSLIVAILHERMDVIARLASRLA